MRAEEKPAYLFSLFVKINNLHIKTARSVSGGKE